MFKVDFYKKKKVIIDYTPCALTARAVRTLSLGYRCNVRDIIQAIIDILLEYYEFQQKLNVEHVIIHGTLAIV